MKHTFIRALSSYKSLEMLHTKFDASLGLIPSAPGTYGLGLCRLTPAV